MQLQPARASTPILSIGDAGKNVGPFAVAILSQPELTHGKFVLAYVEKTTSGGLLQTWSKATGKPAVYVQTSSMEEYNNIWPMWGEEMGTMMKFWDEEGDKSWTGEDNVLTKEDLGITDKFVGNHEAFQSMDWSAL